jgi:vancomycin resistance protein YoaR
MSKEGLEVLARMKDSKLQVRDVVTDWLLLTYDIPHNEAGDKARQQFLIDASAIGATRHTDSVYLMPDSPEAKVLALKLADTKGGEVIVWCNAQPLNHQAEVSAAYDNALRQMVREISGRLDKMQQYANLNHQKRVIQMVPKTQRLLVNAEAAILRRGSELLALRIELLKERFRQVI